MTAGASAATGNRMVKERPTAPKHVRSRRKWGDISLRIVAGLVLLYLFLPIMVIVLFSFNDPAGKFNYTWQGFTLDNWADPFKYPALTEALKLSLNIAFVSTLIALVPRHAAGHRPGTPALYRISGRRHVHDPAADRTRGGDGCLAADAVPGLRLGRGLHHHPDRACGLRGQLHRDDGAGPGARFSTGRWRTRRWIWVPARRGRSSR